MGGYHLMLDGLGITRSTGDERAFADVFSCRPFRWARPPALARGIWAGDWRSEYFERSGYAQRAFVGSAKREEE